ncbi:MAG: transcription repressor NadR [Clostridia bacterium]|nr:transcription repressor NadR [Clostridia bacterium]
MNGEQRRQIIIEKLKTVTQPTSATAFAKELGVTRQIIVADVALLRAAGYQIKAEHKGYVLDNQQNGITKLIVVKHGKNDVSNEFYAIVDNGGKVVDVVVDHHVYGKLSAELNISSRYDANCFVEKMEKEGVNPLSFLTEGMHLHTIIVNDENSFERIKLQLNELGFLIETN